MQLRQLKQWRKEILNFFSGFLFAVAFVASLTAILFCNPRFKREIHILNISVDTHEFHDFFMLLFKYFQFKQSFQLHEFGREHDKTS